MNDLREQFPFFKKSDQVWLDSASTTQKPSILFDTEQKVYQEENANIHRGLYASSELITEKYEDARAVVAQWINALKEELIFTSGTTAAINCIATYWAPLFVKKGDEIIITIAEHHSNFLPWQRYAEQVGAVLTVIPYDQENRRLDFSSVSITEKTKLVAVSHYSNVLGPIWNKKSNELVTFLKKAQSVGAFTFLDAAQSMPHQKLDVQELPVDAAAFSAHKVCGPTAVGGLFLRKKWHEKLPPFFVGGGMVNRASLSESTWLPAPVKFEAGTPAIVQAISWGAALNLLNGYITKQDKKSFQSLVRYTVEGLTEISELQILGNLKWIQKTGSLLSFHIPGIHAHDIAAFLAHEWIAVRAGHHCAQPLLESLSITSSVRISLFYYNTKEDVDKFLKVLQKAIKFLK